MNIELSKKAFWGLAIVGIVLVGGILFFVMRSSDPAARGPIVTRPFNPAVYMTPDATRKKDEALARFDHGGGAHVINARPTQH
jgi:hypothetical protein